MAKTTAPALSFGASGSVAKSMVYSTWKGIKYTRQHVIPANPQTTEQMTTRNLFSMLSKFWTVAPSAIFDTWNAQAKGQKYSGRNHLIGQNVKAMRGKSDMSDFIGSPGSGSGFPLATASATNDTSEDKLSVTVTLPTLPTDWEITSIVAIAFGDASDPTDWVPLVVSATTTKDTLTWDVSGLPNDQDNIVSVWPVYTRPDGKTAYGPSLTTTATAAA